MEEGGGVLGGTASCPEEERVVAAGVDRDTETMSVVIHEEGFQLVVRDLRGGPGGRGGREDEEETAPHDIYFRAGNVRGFNNRNYKNVTQFF